MSVNGQLIYAFLQGFDLDMAGKLLFLPQFLEKSHSNTLAHKQQSRITQKKSFLLCNSQGFGAAAIKKCTP